MNNAIKILKSLDWEDIFENTSQYENLYDFLRDDIKLDCFIEGVYPRGKNRKLVKLLKEKDIPVFKKHAKKLWNLSNVQDFCNGDEEEKRQKYLDRL